MNRSSATPVDDAAPGVGAPANGLKAFLLTATVVGMSLIAAVWLWAANGRMWFFDIEYPMWQAKTKMLVECQFGETVIVGDSRPVAGLMPLAMGGDVTNLALGGGSPLESFHIAEKLLKCPSPPKRVIVSFSTSHLMAVDVYWDRSALFGFLTFAEMEEIRKASQQLSDSVIYPQSIVSPLLNQIRNASYALGFPSYYFPAMVNARFAARKGQNDQTFESTIRQRGHHFFGTAPRSDWPSYDGLQSQLTPSHLLDLYFRKTITLLTQNRVSVYFVSMPLNETTMREVRPALPTMLGQYLKQLEERYPGFRLVGDVLPALPNEYFGDPVHLNERGARMWSELVARNIVEASKDESRFRASPP